jgi:hypothetical protein
VNRAWTESEQLQVVGWWVTDHFLCDLQSVHDAVGDALGHIETTQPTHVQGAARCGHPLLQPLQLAVLHARCCQHDARHRITPSHRLRRRSCGLLLQGGGGGGGEVAGAGHGGGARRDRQWDGDERRVGDGGCGTERRSSAEVEVERTRRAARDWMTLRAEKEKQLHGLRHRRRDDRWVERDV